MKYKSNYTSPIGKLLIITENGKLTGIYFDKNNVDNIITKDDEEQIIKTKNWLDKYFNKENPLVEEIEMKLEGTKFQKQVWSLLLNIPYGNSMTYGEIARELNCKCARAVGRAVHNNPISIIIPCHRVLGKNSTLTGYAGGLDKKKKLLDLENIEYKE